MNDLFLAIGFGLVTASIVALSTVALSLQYGVTNIPNFAHGELLTIGAYGALVTQNLTGNVILAAVVAAALGGGVGWLMNWGLIQPFIRAGAKNLVLFIVTIAVSLVLQNIIVFIFSGADVAYTLAPSSPHNVGPFLFTGRDLMTMGGAVLIMVLLHLLLRYTKFGKAQRAVADNRDLAGVSGINAPRIIELTWLLAGVIAGLAGFVLAVNAGSFGPTTGAQYLIVTFAAAVVGGIGKVYGAVVGAFIVGVAMEVSALYLAADYKLVVAFALLILTLLVRPSGLFATSLRNVAE